MKPTVYFFSPHKRGLHKLLKQVVVLSKEGFFSLVKHSKQKTKSQKNFGSRLDSWRQINGFIAGIGEMCLCISFSQLLHCKMPFRRSGNDHIRLKNQENTRLKLI